MDSRPIELDVLWEQHWPAGTRFVANISGQKVFWMGVVTGAGVPLIFKTISHRRSGLFAVDRDDKCIRIYPNGKTVTAFHKLREFRPKKRKMTGHDGLGHQGAERQLRGNNHETYFSIRPQDTNPAA